MTNANEMITTLRTGRRVLDNYVDKVTDENIGFRIHPEANSIGFLMRHIAEVEHGLSNLIFNGPALDFERITVGPGITDNGEHTDTAHLKNMLSTSLAALENAFTALTPEEWEETVERRMGTFSRRDYVTWLAAHTGYHAGQIVLAQKYGKRW